MKNLPEKFPKPLTFWVSDQKRFATYLRHLMLLLINPLEESDVYQWLMIWKIFVIVFGTLKNYVKSSLPSAITVGTKFAIFFQQGYQGGKFTMSNLFFFVTNANCGTVAGAFYSFITFFARFVSTIFMFKTKKILEIGSASWIFQPRFWINGKSSF